MEKHRIRRLLTSLLFSFCLIHIVVAWEVRDRVLSGFPDYTIFHTAGTILHRGLAARLYDARLQYQIQQEFVLAARRGRGLLPYNHLPYEALLFLPLSYLPYLTAYAIWVVLNVALFLLSLWLLRPYLPSLPQFEWTIWALLAVGFFPAFASLFEGQDSILVLLLYTLAFIDLKHERPMRAGLWLALSLVKFQVALPFMAIAVLTRRWKLVLGFALSALGVALASIAVVGWRTAVYYPLFVARLEKTTAAGAIVPRNMPNLHGLVDAGLSWTKTPAVVVAVTAILSLPILLLVARTLRYQSARRDEDSCFSLAVVASVLLSYHCFEYDWTVLLLPALLGLNNLAAQAQITRWGHRLLCLSLVGVFLSPLYLIPLARFGHLYGLAIFLVVWTWALVLEIRQKGMPGEAGVRENRLQAATADV